MWLLRQDALNETIDRLSTLLSNEDRWIASNAALVLARCEGVQCPCLSTTSANQVLSLVAKQRKVVWMFCRLTIAEEGCARILNHPHSNSTLKQLIRSLNVDGDGNETDWSYLHVNYIVSMSPVCLFLCRRWKEYGFCYWTSLWLTNWASSLAQSFRF